MIECLIDCSDAETEAGRAKARTAAVGETATPDHAGPPDLGEARAAAAGTVAGAGAQAVAIEHERERDPMFGMSDEAATLLVLTGPMAGQAKGPLRLEARQSIPKIMRKKILEQPETPWTPELVVQRVYRDTSPKTIQILGLLGIDDDELRHLARKALRKAGRTWKEGAGTVEDGGSRERRRFWRWLTAWCSCCSCRKSKQRRL